MPKREHDIPTSGKHRGGEEKEFETGTNVRAPEPYPASENRSEASASVEPAKEGTRPTYQLLYNEEEQFYRVQTWNEEAETPDPFEVVGEFESHADIEDHSTGLGDGPRFMVFENTDTGDLLYETENTISDNWTGENDFNQITIFDTEEQADAYVQQRQSESSKHG